jgi:hypothetical protein
MKFAMIVVQMTTTQVKEISNMTQTMRTIDELVNEMYMDNEAHLEYMENMNGGDCDCNIHTTLNTIVKYWWDEEN